jgi:hypothetical protein
VTAIRTLPISLRLWESIFEVLPPTVDIEFTSPDREAIGIEEKGISIEALVFALTQPLTKVHTLTIKDVCSNSFRPVTDNTPSESAKAYPKSTI